MRTSRVAVAGLVVAGLLAGTLAGSAEAQADSALAPLYGLDVTTSSGAARVVPGGYIVVLKDGATDDAGDVAKAASARAQELGASITRTYTHGLHGYSAKLSDSELSAVRRDPAVAYVERDQIIHVGAPTVSKPLAAVTVSASAASTQRNVDSWGLDRMDQRNLPLDGTYYSQSQGTAAAVYVISSGINIANQTLPYPLAGADLVGGDSSAYDCEALGTFTANIIGGQYYGVAKGVPVNSVRVVDCAGNTSVSTVVAGLEWVLNNADIRSLRGVVDLGVQAPNSQAIDDATTNLIQAGVPVVTGTLSDDDNGCALSPTRLPDVIAVSASTVKDQASSVGATGSCVDLWAPGENVRSQLPDPTGGHDLYYGEGDGADFSAAYVTGALVQYLRAQKFQPVDRQVTVAEIMAGLTQMSTKNKVTGVPAGTTANLVFSKVAVTPPAGITGGDRLRSGESLVRDGKSRLTSKAGAYYLTYRASDGHLCLYTAATGRAHWCATNSAAWTNMNTSGSLSSYDGYGQKVWTTSTAKGISTMVVNDKGYIYIKRDSDGVATWSSPH